ncbi:DUF1460 domain-containing protein [candidate division KSB1 bacterium]|nr:DUF1460 domain-containing protein [candidate division KSB1 bacterium]MBL7093981.1 DUF1460 domain-containing protein [candidate division KSB1 bacterium]
MRNIFSLRINLFILVFLIFINALAANPGDKFCQLSVSEINQILTQLQKDCPDFEDRFRAITFKRLNTPYSLKPIGDGKCYDPNPVFNIATTNCTAFILTNVALASARTYQQAGSAMAYLNYYPVLSGQDPINYQNRIHYTTHRLLTSDYFYLITDSIANKSEQRTINLVLNRQKNGSHFLPIDWEGNVELNYIPRENIAKETLSRFPAVCGVGIIRKELFEKGIIIGHEGIVIDGEDFIHASLAAGKVVQENFYSYTQKRRKRDGKFVCDGIVVYKMKEVKE